MVLYNMCIVSGQCITSGDNTHGELGRSSTMNPGIVDTLKDKTVTCVSCGDWYTMACTTGMCVCVCFNTSVINWPNSTKGYIIEF